MFYPNVAMVFFKESLTQAKANIAPVLQRLYDRKKKIIK